MFKFSRNVPIYSIENKYPNNFSENIALEVLL